MPNAQYRMQRRSNKETRIPQPITTFIRAVSEHDADAFLSSFTNDAVVTDVGQEFRGTAAIKEWGDREIFGVNVTLDVIDVNDRDGQTVVTVKVEGKLDKTGRHDYPLLAEQFSQPC